MLAACMALIDEPSDKELFKRIFRQNKKLMYKVAFSILKNRTLAEEALQESLIAIAYNIKKFNDPNSDRTAALITIIARNKAISLQRREHKERGGETTINIDEEIEIIDLDEMTIRENFDAVISAIKSLNTIYSDVMMLKYVYGYDVKTISGIFDVPEKTIESRLYRGRKQFAEKMEDLYGSQKSR